MNRLNVSVSRILQWLASVTSPLIRVLLAGNPPAPMSRRLLLLSFIGRKTGRAYATPVSYVREGNELLVPGGGRWWKNLASGPVRVRVYRSWLDVAATDVVAEPPALSEVLGRMMAANPALSVFTGIRRGPDGRPDPRSLESARRRGFVVVRLHVAEEHRTAQVA